MRRIKRFLLNTLILGAASVAMRAVALVFNAYIANRIGAEGMGLFSLISSVYVFGVTLASAGIQLSVNRLVSEELAADNPRGASACLKTAALYAAITGTAAQIMLFSASGYIGRKLLGDARTVLSLRALSVSLPFIALSNVFSGYFYAVRRVIKSAAANVTEQAVKIALTVALLVPMLPRGMEYACLAVVIGMSASEGASLFFLFILWLFDRKKHIKPSGREVKSPGRRLLSISVPIALSSLLRSALLTFEHVLIPRGLKRHGLDSAAALSAYGVIHGMVFPVILFPSALTGAVAGLMVAEMSSEATESGEYGSREIRYMVKRSYQMTLLYAVAAAGVFVTFADPLGILIYNNAETARYMRIFAAAVPVMYLDTVTDGMLKGLNQQLPSMWYNIIDAAVSVVLVFILVPRLGIAGYVVTVFVTEALNASLSVSRLLIVTGASIPLFGTVVKPLFAALGAAAVCRLVPLRAEGFFSLALGILFFLAVYAAFAIILGAVKREDIRWGKAIFEREEGKVKSE